MIIRDLYFITQQILFTPIYRHLLSTTPLYATSIEFKTDRDTSILRL